MELVCLEELQFKLGVICEYDENMTCNGCIHLSFYEMDGHLINKIYYLLSVLITGFSQLVGLGAEMQKTSILMGLLKYNEYEATNITYFISIGSSFFYFLFILFYFKEAHQIDFLAIQLLFPFIVICTDVGNYLNRLIYDQVIVFFTIGIEIIQGCLLFREYKILQKQEKRQKEINRTMLAAFNTNYTLHSQSLIRVCQGERKQTNKDLWSVFYIIVGQLTLQFSLFFFRGGNNREGIFVEQYNNWVYWLVTGIVYFIGIVIAYILYKFQAKHYQKMKIEADPQFYDFRNMKESILLAFFGMISFFCSGIAGVGAGIILIPCCIIFQSFKMSIQRAISTMILIQLLIDLCVFLQRFQNVNSVGIEDLTFYFVLGSTASLFITLFLHQLLIKKENQEFHLIFIIILLFCADFIFGIIQASLFKSPNQGAPYFSISIDDCSPDCKYQTYN